MMRKAEGKKKQAIKMACFLLLAKIQWGLPGLNKSGEIIKSTHC